MWKSLLLNFARDHVGEYLKLAVAVQTKAGMWLDAVLVENAQASEGFVFGIVMTSHIR